jgi:hypothetical protein
MMSAAVAGTTNRTEPAFHSPRPFRPTPSYTTLRDVTRDRLLRETFQSYDGVSRALGMAGLSGQWSAIGSHMTPTREPSEIKERLDAIVVRRNQIVHEGDYERKERPRNATLSPITQSQAAADIDFVAQLVDAIHAVI